MIKKKKQKNIVSLCTNLYCAFWNVIVIFIHYINLKRSSFRGFYLACSTMIALTPQTTELIVWLCEIRTMKMICIWHPMWERPWPRLHLIPCPKCLLSNRMMLGSLGITINTDLVPKVLEILYILLFSVNSYPNKLGNDWRNWYHT